MSPKSKKPEFCCDWLRCDSKTGCWQCKPFEDYREDHLEKGNKGCGATIFLPSIKKLLNKELARQQEEYKDAIRKKRKESRAVLALGAGVSMSKKMPNWTGLLSRMSGYALQYHEYIETDPKRSEEDKTRLQILEKELISGKIDMLGGINALEAAQYIRLTLGKDGGTARDERDGLLKSIIAEIIDQNISPEKFKEDDKCPSALRGKKEVEEEKKNRALFSLARRDTLFAVASLLRAKGGFRQALTYNYDTLVQEYLISPFFNVPEERIVTHSEGWTPIPKNVKDPIEILHVHGYLPRPGMAGRSTAFPEESKRLILSEDSYYSIERGAYDWRNSVQSYFFNRDTCVFTGFSAEDYNFRRILRQRRGDAFGRSNEERPKHYLILTIGDLAKDVYASICRGRLETGVDPEKLREDARLLLNQELAMKAAYWKRYDFYPIWAATYHDVPGILMSLLQEPKGGGTAGT